MRAALLLAAAVALGACRDSTRPQAVKGGSDADSADQVMFGARAVLTDRGLLRAEMQSDTAYWFDDNTRIEMRTVHTTFFTAAGAKSAVLTSREGTYNTRAGRMEARRNVVVVSEDGRRLTTTQLRFDERANEISSDSAFVLTEPGRRLDGVGFTSDPGMNHVRCLGACRGSAGAVSLPGPGAQQPAPAGTFRLPGQGPQ